MSADFAITTISPTATAMGATISKIGSAAVPVIPPYVVVLFISELTDNGIVYAPMTAVSIKPKIAPI